MPKRLKSKIKKLPIQPGIYLMLGLRKKVIYIGKARNLKERVSNYFQAGLIQDPKTAYLVKKIKDIDYIPTDSELDALLLEARLIRQIKPKYNIQLKDDKSLPLLTIDSRDDFPRVFISRLRGKKDHTYFGPFSNVRELRSAVKSLQRIFKFRICSRTITERKPSKVCLLYHINQCTAPCAGKTSKAGYKDIIKNLTHLLKNNKKKAVSALSEKMRLLSESRDFEKAADLRDQINALRGLSQKSKIAEFYEGSHSPPNPDKRLLDLQALLGMAKIPKKIEGIDISDIKGRDAVGSLVTFIDSKPYKNGYRKYKIKYSKDGKTDDYQRMSEVLKRRLNNKSNPLPDILLIDGGRGHLSVIEKVFAKCKITPPMIVALSKHKGDHIVTNSQSKLANPKKHASGFGLLQYVRDEAHRFAQKYHHYLRGRSTLK